MNCSILKFRIKFAFILFSIFVLLSCAKKEAISEFINENDTSQELQSKLEQLRSKYNTKGVSASALLPGEEIWTGVSGSSHGSVPISSSMKFGIASNTKLFVSVAMLKLVEKSIINLDDSLHEWLPPMNNVNPNITIEQLLNHSSGIADFINIKGYQDSINIDPTRKFTPEEVMTWVGKPDFEKGTQNLYSSSNFVLAGMIIESATNEKLEKYIHDHILSSYSLNNTFFPIYETITGDIAHPWHEGKDIFNISRNSILSSFWSAGAMYSSSEDMGKWYRSLFENQIISSKSMETITTFEGKFGLGIMKFDLNGRIVYGHRGKITGYRSFILYDIETKAIVCVLTNQDEVEKTREMAQEILAELVK